MPKGRVTRILQDSKRSGSSDKGPWNIMEVEVEREDGSLVKADTFDIVVPQDMVELTPNSYTSTKTGQTYHGFNANIPKAPKPGSGGDQSQEDVMLAIRMVYRVVQEVNDKLDTLMGVDKPLPTAVSVAAHEPVDEEPTVEPIRDESEPLPEMPGDINDFMNQA